MKNSFFPLIIILALTTLAFWPSLHNGFTDWDDNRYVTGNPLIKNLRAENVKAIFTRVVTGEGHYHPLTHLSFALEYHFFKLTPFIYHLDNLLLHSLNSVLVFFFILKLAHCRLTAFITALLFAIHPMHVESVAWVPGRKDVLSTAFYLGSLLSYLNCLDVPNRKTLNRFLAVVLFLGALLSKPSAVTLPLSMLCCDYYRERKDWAKFLAEKIPLFAISVVFGLFAIAQKASDEISFSLIERVLFAGYSLWMYIVKAVFPFNLTAFYDFPRKAPSGNYPAGLYLAAAAAAALLGFAFWYFRKKREVVFGLLVFLLTMAPVLGIIKFSNYLMAERYTYFSYIGLFFIIATAFRGLTTQGSSLSAPMKRFVQSLLGIFVVGFIWLTFWRCFIWNNALTLWTDVINKNPGVALAYASRGAAYSLRGELQLALNDFDKAIALAPKQQTAYINRGNLYSKLKRYRLAILDYNTAEQLRGSREGVYLNRGVAFSRLKRWEPALADFNKAIQLNPDNAMLYLNKGNIFFEQELYEEAIVQYSKTIELEPGMNAAFYARGLAHARLGNQEAADLDLNRAAGNYSM